MSMGQSTRVRAAPVMNYANCTCRNCCISSAGKAYIKRRVHRAMRRGEKAEIEASVDAE